MKVDEIDRLLDPSPMRLEMGYERLENGVLHIACRTDLHKCTGEMFEWWFRSRPDTEKYIWWHPVDHVFSDWVGGAPDTHVGSIHKVEEYFSGLPAEKLYIQFRDSTEFFNSDLYANARKSHAISGAVCGRVGMGWEPPTLPDGKLLGGRLFHITRDTDWGCVLRSHFYLGQDLPNSGLNADEVASIVKDEMGQALLKHCYDEFTMLSRFLPSLFAAENRKTHKVKLPW